MSKELVERIAKLELELAELKAAQAKTAPKPEFKPTPMPKYDPTEGFRLPASAAQAMARVVPDVKQGGFDAHAWAQTKGPGEPGGFGSPTRSASPVERGTGWTAPRPIEPPPGIQHVDAIASHFDVLDRLEQVKKLVGLLKPTDATNVATEPKELNAGND